jgi:hypothetical protein
MSKNNYNDWNHHHDENNRQISKRPMPDRVKSNPLESAGDDLVWAIEALIDEPTSIKRWFLVKDAITKYKLIRKDRF